MVKIWILSVRVKKKILKEKGQKTQIMELYAPEERITAIVV